jgi:phospholipid/cholesterol/gamma-HCH transport system ATP-binding protein
MQVSNRPGDAVVKVSQLTTVMSGQTLHDGINLEIRENEILGLVGASGSGKSVLLQCLIGLHRPASGTVNIFGKDLYGSGETERRQIAKHWGVVFQENALFSTLTVLENIMLVMREQAGIPEELARELAVTKLILAGLPTESGNQFPSELSGGMRKRAAIARAIAVDPTLLLLDEPTTGLDPIAAGRLDSLILTLKRTLKPGILVITHDLDTLFNICDRVLVLADKKIVACGTPDEVVNSQHSWAQEYFQGARGKAAYRSAHATTNRLSPHRQG